MTDPIDAVVPANGVPPAVVPPAVTDESPPRASWSSRAPESVWCPAPWHALLHDLVPAWEAPGAGDSTGDSTDVVTGSLSAGAWSVIAASRRGRLHAHRGDHREDAIAMRRIESGWCGAVADGAGSAPWSRIGAAVATHTFCATFAARTGPSRPRATAAADATFATLRALAEAFGVPPRALRTTLLAVAVVGDEILTLQVGDGGIALIGHDGVAQLPQAGDSGEFSGEVTHFLPDDGSRERLVASLHVSAASAARAVILASDGIEDPWYPFARHAPLLVESIEHGVTDARAAAIHAANGVQFAWRGEVRTAHDAATALGDWMTFEKRGENDDRSLLFARLHRDR